MSGNGGLFVGEGFRRMAAALHGRRFPCTGQRSILPFTETESQLCSESPAVIAPSGYPLVPLEALRSGESGLVADLDGPANSINRLRELGVQVGQRVKMLRPGPPHLVQLGECRLCLRPESDVIVLIGLNQD